MGRQWIFESKTPWGQSVSSHLWPFGLYGSSRVMVQFHCWRKFSLSKTREAIKRLALRRAGHCFTFD